MESYEIIAAAAKAGVPTTVLRIVADAFEQRMPDFNRALRVDGDFDGWMALKVALGSPLLTAKLVAANRRATPGLGKALKIVLGADCFSEATLGKPSVPNLRAGPSWSTARCSCVGACFSSFCSPHLSALLAPGAAIQSIYS